MSSAKRGTKQEVSLMVIVWWPDHIALAMHARDKGMNRATVKDDS